MKKNENLPEDEQLPVDVYIKQPFAKKMVDTYTDEESPLYDEDFAPRSEVADEIDQISVECCERGSVDRPLHPLVLAALKKGRGCKGSK